MVSSLKRYKLELLVRDEIYPVYGLGAIFTQQRFREQGYASELIESVIDEAQRSGQQAVFLFSDIGADYYERFGFEPLGHMDFLIDDLNLVAPHLVRSGVDEVESTFRPLDVEHINQMVRIHRRWLRRQPFGFVRDETYLSFKLEKEKFMHKNSRLDWPSIEVAFCSSNTAAGARSGNGSGSSASYSYEDARSYALVERSKDTLRVLEVVGDEADTITLWKLVMEKAVKHGVQRVRGWESAAAAFAPGFNIGAITSQNERICGKLPTHLACYERQWALPMILPFHPILDDLYSSVLCPLMELDHF